MEYEIAHSGGTKRSNRYVNASKDERAVKYLMGKHGLGGTVEQHLETYLKEKKAVEAAKLGRKLSTAEVKVLKQKKTKIIMTRVNPEWHKPDHDNPEGRSKMGWLVLGYPAGCQVGRRPLRVTNDPKTLCNAD